MSAPHLPNVFSIPASAAFAETLARGAIARIGTQPLALADAVVYLPTRRAARTFGDAFAQQLGGSALLPSFRPLGGIDENDGWLDDEQLDLPPAMSSLRRRLLLASLIRRWCRATRQEEMGSARAAALADSLAALFDEAETQGADFGNLDSLVEGSLAKHWQEVRDFLKYLREEWPKIVADEGTVGAVTRRNLALHALAERLRNAGDKFVIAAGSTGSIPATATLLSVIAQLPNGAVVLPGLDRSLNQNSWDQVALDPSHPQFGLRQLLDRMNIERERVRDWVPESPPNLQREIFVSEVLRPAPTTDFWRDVAEAGTADIAQGLNGLSLVEAADPAEESTVIALIMRRVLEDAEKSAALVTPDRTLARRVAAELRRWSIEIDDSAGQPLSRTAVGTFLCLIAEAAEARFAPVPLLALLRHPLASLGNREDFLRLTRKLDLALRGPRPNPGLGGIRAAIASTKDLPEWFAHLVDALGPLELLMEKSNASLEELLAAHRGVAVGLSGDGAGKTALWEQESGEAAKLLVEELDRAASGIPSIEPSSYPAFFRLAADEVQVHPQRGLHPRLSILGPLEARLQSFDLVIVGGLNEGQWPRAAAIDPWLSRPMRKSIGLEPPERALGLSAHDFEMLATQAEVVLTRAMKADGAPTVASRWIQRLQQFSKGLDLESRLVPSVDWCGMARSLHELSGAPKPVERPCPSPPVSARPRRLSITEIETWRRDPYAIYARRVLRLEQLDPLDGSFGALERGTLVHAALERFVTRYPSQLPPRAGTILLEIAEELFKEQGIPKAVIATWRPRFISAADWFIENEQARRSGITRSELEKKGELAIEGPAGTFVLHGRADRIDILREGGAAIIDYKTGRPPTDRQVKEMLAPQLPLEAAMLARGGFADIGPIDAKVLAYLQFSGGREPGRWCQLDFEPAEIAGKYLDLLQLYVQRFDSIDKGYLSRAIAYRSDLLGPYDQLARYGEWTTELIEDEEES